MNLQVYICFCLHLFRLSPFFLFSDDCKAWYKRFYNVRLIYRFVNCGLIDGNQLLNACGLQFTKVCVPVVVRHAACYPLIDITVNDISEMVG